MTQSDTMLSNMIFTRHAILQYRIRCQNECGISVPRNAVEIRELILEQLHESTQISVTKLNNWKIRLQLHPESVYLFNKDIGMVFVLEPSTKSEAVYALVTCFPPNPKEHLNRRKIPKRKGYYRAEQNRLARLAYEYGDIL